MSTKLVMGWRYSSDDIFRIEGKKRLQDRVGSVWSHSRRVWKLRLRKSRNKVERFRIVNERKPFNTCKIFQKEIVFSSPILTWHYQAERSKVTRGERPIKIKDC
jgi:hypothetical protein